MIRVLYIAGSGRSGSTLFERMLGQDERFTTVGELRHLWKRVPERELCGCGELIVNCPFWSEVLARVGIDATSASFENMRSLQQQVDRMRHIPAMLRLTTQSSRYSTHVARYSALLIALYQSILDVGKGQIIVDSSKDISTLYLLTTMGDIDLRILHMVRDSRAVAFSWMRQRVRPHIVDRVSYMHVYSPQKSALDWNYRNLGADWARNRAAAYYQLRYEDLICEPRDRLSGVGVFAGIDQIDLASVSNNDLHFGRESHTVSGNPMRFTKGAVSLRMDNAWKTEMSHVNRQIVTGLTWPLLRRYGYTLDPWERPTDGKGTLVRL